jgi:hypothetical protein
MPGLIRNPLSINDVSEVKHDYSSNMCFYSNIDTSFHCKAHPEELLGADGKVDEDKAQAQRDELKSRLDYLAKKWKAALEDPEKSLLCVLTPSEEHNTTEEIMEIYAALQEYPLVDLLVVLTGKEKFVSAEQLQKKGIFVRYISHHPPHDKVTDKDLNDLEGWNRIGHEFRPLIMKISNKVYKYEK